MKIKCVLIEITSNCNHGCLYCYNDIKKPLYMSLVEIEHILRQVAAYDVDTIILSGGEPLLHPNFIDIIHMIKRYGMNYALPTNGTRITEDIIDCFQSDNASVQISFDSINPEIYSKLRQTQDYNFVINNIKNCLFKKIPLCIGIVLNKYSVVTLKETIEYFMHLGVQMFHVEEVVMVGQAVYSNIDLNIDNFYAVLQDLYFLETTYYPQITIDFIENIFLNMMGHISGKGYCNCMNGNAFQIDILGNVYSCKNHAGIPKYGNIFEDPLSTIALNIQCRDCYDKIPDCQTCSYGAICKGLCRANSYEYYCSLNMPARRCHEMKEFLNYVMKEKKTGKLDKFLLSIEWNSKLFNNNEYTKWI